MRATAQGTAAALLVGAAAGLAALFVLPAESLPSGVWSFVAPPLGRWLAGIALVGAAAGAAAWRIAR